MKPAALWALRQSGSKNFIAVVPLLQKDVGQNQLSKWDAGLKPDCQKGTPD